MNKPEVKTYTELNLVRAGNWLVSENKITQQEWNQFWTRRICSGSGVCNDTTVEFYMNDTDIEYHGIDAYKVAQLIIKEFGDVDKYLISW